MSQSLNQMQSLGRLGKDPENKFTPSGRNVTTGTIAMNRKFKDGSGNDVEKTEWLNWEAWGKLGEILHQYLHKGDQVFFQGRIQTDKVEGEGGNRYFTKMVVLDVVFCGGKRDGERHVGNEAEVGSEVVTPSEDEFPF